MKRYSQNFEQDVILEYFKDVKKPFVDLKFLDIGANNGKLLSNTYALALLGAFGVVVEPSETAFKELQKTYEDNVRVFCLKAAIGDCNMITTMYESGSHLHKGDTSLLSTLNKADYEKWKGTTDFTEVETECYDVETMLRLWPYRKFDFISVDCEGNDLLVLSQMDLTALECKLLCIEWNSDELTKQLILSHCALHGLNKVLLTNAENIIVCR